MKAPLLFTVAILFVSSTNSQAQILDYSNAAVSHAPVYKQLPPGYQYSQLYTPRKIVKKQVANYPRYQTVQYSTPIATQPYYESPAAFAQRTECCDTCPPEFTPSFSAIPMTGYQPILPVFSMPNSYYVGRGILGQPTLYVPGQTIRNFFRYLGP